MIELAFGDQYKAATAKRELLRLNRGTVNSPNIMPNSKNMWLTSNGTLKLRWTHYETAFQTNSRILYNMPTCQITSSTSSKCAKSETHRSGPEQPRRSQDDGKVTTRNLTT
jgi:hypothetical protein